MHSEMTHSSTPLSLSFFPLHQTVSSSGHGRPESPVYTNLQELKITQTNLPPLPSGSPLHVLGDWETHRDQNGRHFYYNRSTQERTWKPPRARDASIGNSRGESHSTGDSSEVRTVWRENAHIHIILSVFMKNWMQLIGFLDRQQAFYIKNKVFKWW